MSSSKTPADVACSNCTAANPHNFTFCHHCRVPRSAAAPKKGAKKSAAPKKSAKK